MKVKSNHSKVILALIIIGIFTLNTFSFAAESPKVDVNSATKEELMTLSGVGEKVAVKIIAYRDNYGPFETAADMMKVKGIGPKTLEKNKDRIIVKMTKISNKNR